MGSTMTWPWQYDFPPFFTLQPNLETRAKQMEAWASLVLHYCQAQNIHTLEVGEAKTSPLFHNAKIGRRLSDEGIAAVLGYLREREHCEWLDEAAERKTAGRPPPRCHIFWRRPEEWGKLLYDWVAANGLLNSVCTFYELTQTEDTLAEPFHNLDKEILIKALRTLQAQHKAELMYIGGSEGVKFF